MDITSSFRSSSDKNVCSVFNYNLTGVYWCQHTNAEHMSSLLCFSLPKFDTNARGRGGEGVRDLPDVLQSVYQTGAVVYGLFSFKSNYRPDAC